MNNVKKSKKGKKVPHLTNANGIQNTKHKKKGKQSKDNKVAKMNILVQKKKKEETAGLSLEKNNSRMATRHSNLDLKKLEEMLAAKQKQMTKKKDNPKPVSLRERMMTKLKASRFRYLNETMYNSESSESKKYFKDDPDAFKAYHEGYQQQVEQWPLNPIDVIISSIKKLPKDYIIADFGCGEAQLAASVTHKVHSFDFVSLNENVTVCDMAHTPVLTNGVQVVVFCLSLMGTNLKDYIIEANRILKKDGILKIAEVKSRFEQVDDFIKVLSQYGFKNTWKDFSHNLFYFLDFKKEKDISGNKQKLPPITLKPCLYKKR
ncbi:Ribosomal RNA-processing protein 8 [Dufourea novaeangliae]|uniref:Ribosomal RNA-processing protein 8 n=2 Tax=Dufourea novaeangliae TaxID=178035 RepID=A0A154PBH4_DUFNO|nr:Ribosomal RNA-processing protein 8 [Dufourea novaeangliae]